MKSNGLLKGSLKSIILEFLIENGKIYG